VSLEIDNAFHWALAAAIIALFFLGFRFLGGLMVGGPLDSVGNALLNVFP
jgi:hypothetical protein